MSDELIENKPIPYICTVEEMTEQLVEMIKFPDMAITPPDSPILWSFLTDFEETEELEEYKHHNKKNTRRVTFNLEKNELIYYSAISYTSSEASDEDNTVNNTLLVEHPMDSLLNNQPMSRKDIMNMLEKRRENKRYKSPVIQPTHWLPSSASSTLTRVNRVHIPEIRSLELTEKLIEEIIQREIAIYPHLSSNIPHKEDNALINAPRSSYSSEESDTISAGSSDNVPSIQEYPLPTDTNIDYHADTNIDYRTDTNIDYHPIKKSESNFITSYHKMEKIHGKEVIPHNTIQHKDIDIHPNTASVQPVDDISSICMEVTSKPIKDTVPEIKQPLSGSLFMRIVKTESVDLPLSDNSSVEIDCGIYYDSHEVSSVRQPLGRIMNIDHEITIEDIDIDKKICIMLKVDQQYLKKRSIWNKLLNKKQQELDRYVHSQSGAICQTVVASSRLIKSSHEVSAVTGTMVLVNDWYTPHHRHKQSMRKKAVGKIIIQSLYIPRCCSLHSYPQSMKEAIDGTEIRRFYKTTWISGYMQQIGGNTKVPCIRYFRLEGRFITAAIGMQHEVLYKIPLSRVTQLICDKSRILKKEGNSISHRYTLQQLDTLAESHANYPAQNDSTSNYDFKFQLNCDNDDSITFSCESIEERKKWIHFLEVMINYQPDIPDWLHLYDQ